MFIAMLVVFTMLGVRIDVSETCASLLCVKSVSELIGKISPLCDPFREFCENCWYSSRYSAKQVELRVEVVVDLDLVVALVGDLRLWGSCSW